MKSIASIRSLSTKIRRNSKNDKHFCFVLIVRNITILNQILTLCAGSMAKSTANWVFESYLVRVWPAFVRWDPGTAPNHFRTSVFRKGDLRSSVWPCKVFWNSEWMNEIMNFPHNVQLGQNTLLNILK